MLESTPWQDCKRWGVHPGACARGNRSASRQHARLTTVLSGPISVQQRPESALAASM